MTTNVKSLEYRMYLLTVWRAEELLLGNETGWRFLLTDPQTGARYGFTESEGLLSVIQQAIDEEPPAV